MYLPYRKLPYFSAFCNTCAASFSQVKVLRLTYAEVRAMSMGTGLKVQQPSTDWSASNRGLAGRAHKQPTGIFQLHPTSSQS